MLSLQLNNKLFFLIFTFFVAKTVNKCKITLPCVVSNLNTRVHHGQTWSIWVRGWVNIEKNLYLHMAEIYFKTASIPAVTFKFALNVSVYNLSN